MADIEIEIDGKKLTAKPNQMVIEVADAAGIYIPRFCYHKQLSIAANCRMCLVEVEKSPKTLPACATPVMPGMKVFTQSAKTIEAQRAVMEFLLINHPLDCPVCDQGGECELQDISMGYGSDWSHYDECKRSVADENLGPLIETEMTRCILCTRCVRFGDEIAGIRELGVTNRGGHAEISTYVQHAMQSEISGNIIDICPVGALTSKPYRFTARPWELKQSPSIAPHDCLGSHLNVHTLTGKVMRVVARECQTINETWISDRDRFSYTGLTHGDRLTKPMARIHGEWKEVEWQEALKIAAAHLRETIDAFGADELGALATPSATLEELYLFQKLVRALGSANIDHRLREKDTRDQDAMPLFPGMNMSIEALAASDAVLLIGSNFTKEQPMAAARIRKAVREGRCQVLAVNPVDANFYFDVAHKEIVAPHQLPAAIQALAQAIEKKSAHPLADALVGKQKMTIVVGALAQHHPEASVLRSLAQKIAKLTGAEVCMMTDGANTAGAWLAGAIPHRQAAGETIKQAGLSAYAMLANPRKAYLLLNVEPDVDCANSALAMTAIKQAKCVIALSMYRNPVLEENAHVIFPVTPFTETSGTFVNAMGDWQSFTGVAESLGEARPAWKVLRVLANFLELNGFDYESSEAVRDELKALLSTKAETFKPREALVANEPALMKEQDQLSRIGEVPIYSIDGIVRRSEPLHQAQTNMEGEIATARMHPSTAAHFGLSDGDLVKVTQESGEAILLAMISERIPKQAVWVAGGILQTTGLADLFGALKIQKVVAS